MESQQWRCWRNEEGKSDPSSCSVKAGLCVCWAGPMAQRAQWGHCLFGKSYGILLQLFMEENIWCFWKSLGVGGCLIRSRSLSMYMTECYVSVGVFGAEKLEAPLALVPGMREEMALPHLRLMGSGLPAPLTCWCFLCVIAQTAPLWLKSGPVTLILN